MVILKGAQTPNWRGEQVESIKRDIIPLNTISVVGLKE